VTDAKVTQVAVDVTVVGDGSAQVTQVAAEILVEPPPPDGQVTQVGVDVVATEALTEAQVTQTGLDVVVRPDIQCVDTTGRIITSPLHDATLRTQYLGHRAFVEVTEDGYGTAEAALTWDLVQDGFCTRATLEDALSWEFEIGDTDRIEQRAQLFAGAGLVVGQPSNLLGSPVTGGFDQVPDDGLPIFQVTAVGTDPFVTLQYKSGPLPVFLGTPGRFYAVGFFPNSQVEYNQDYLNGIARPFAVRSPDYLSYGRGYAYPQLVVELYNWFTGDLVTTLSGSPITGALRGVQGAFTPLSRNTPIRPRSFRQPRRVADDRLFGAGLEFAIDWETNQPSIGQYYAVRMYAAVATTKTPFHFAGHPVDIAASIYDALGIAYDATSVSDTRAALGDDHVVYLRPTSAEKALTVLEDWLQGPHGFAYRVVSGLREFYPTRFRDNTTPTQALTLASLRAPGTPFELPGQSVITRVVWEELSFGLWEDTTDEPVDQRPLDGLLAAASTQTYDQEDANAPSIGRDQVYRYPGYIPDPVRPGPLVSTGFKQGVAEELFFRWGRGCAEVSFPCLPSVAARIGEYVVNDVDFSPIPETGPWPVTVRPKDYPDRTPRQILQVVKRTETPSGPDLRLLVVGPVSADLAGLTTPTLSIAADAALPKNLAIVTVTNWGTIAVSSEVRVEVQYALGASPTGWTPIGALYPTGNGVTGTPLVDGGSHVWARARTVHSDGRIGAWSASVNVDLTDLTAPSGFSATPTGDTTADLAWTNGEATLPIAVDLKEDTATAWTRWVTLPPGTTSYSLVLPETSTTYDVRIFHEEYPPLRGTSAVVTDQVITGTTAATLASPYHAVITSGGGTGQLCVRAGASFADFVFEYRVTGAPSFDPLARVLGGPLGLDACASFVAPAFGTTYDVRVRHEQTGLTASAWVTVVVDPWADTVPSASDSIDFFSTTDPASNPLNNVAAGSYWLKTDDLTTPTWLEYYRRDQANAAWMRLWAWSAMPDTWSQAEMPYVDTDGRLAMVAPGSNGEILGLVGGVPVWRESSGSVGGDQVDAVPLAPDAMDDEFNGSALDGKWTWVNQGTASAAFSYGALVMTLPASAGPNWRSIVQAAPSGQDFMVVAKIALPHDRVEDHWVGLTARNATNDKMFVIGILGNGAAFNYYPLVQYWTDLTTFDFNLFASQQPNAAHLGRWLYVRLRYDDGSAILNFDYSANGIVFTEVAQWSVFITLGTLDEVGLAFNADDPNPSSYLVDWFRRTA
jgi:hypothetical protein